MSLSWRWNRIRKSHEQGNQILNKLYHPCHLRLNLALWRGDDVDGVEHRRYPLVGWILFWPYRGCYPLVGMGYSGPPNASALAAFQAYPPALLVCHSVLGGYDLCWAAAAVCINWMDR